ncbi:hypothetical protein CDL12_03693 [Handroanthus impetiginosus]|uniref:Endonuclease/exonuclease/phosphatase domain-containing protein n=1 Tax=Handroanthus impetiginosus TaxID=429701 RepID=A0A2G9I1E9_9LAMI|nr:hypothetical protein CDL12_03693 [Handroanthus impetiginosus]
MTSLDATFMTHRFGFASVLTNWVNQIWCVFMQLFRLSFVHAKCNRWGHQILWDDLRSICTNGPWVVGRDFNIISSISKWKGGATPKLKSMEEFNEYIEGFCLMDPIYEGSPYTWTNKRGLWQRLDRVLVSNTLLDVYPTIQVQYLNCVNLEQYPLFLTASNLCTKGMSTF